MLARLKQAFFTQILLCTLLPGLLCSNSDNQILYTDGRDCGTEVSLLGSATVYSHYRPDVENSYSHSQECGIIFKAEKESWRLMITFEYLDIPDLLYNGVCTDAVHIYDAKKIGVRPFPTAGGQNGLCGDNTPSVIASTGPYINVYFRTDRSGTRGRGFKFQITAFTDALDSSTCSQSHFYCKAANRCIDSNLLCDRIKNCPNGEDEEDDGDSMCNPTEKGGLWKWVQDIGIAGFIGIVAGCLVIVILLIVCVVCTCRRCGKVPGETDHRQSIPSMGNGNAGAMGPQLLNKNGVMYQPVPQVAPGPMNTHMMQQNALNQQYAQQGLPPGQQGYCLINSANQQHMVQQRPGYMAAAQQHPAMEMQMMNTQQLSSAGGVVSHPATAPPPAGYINNYNSPFHLARGVAPESHSYSSGYSSQLQGPAGAGGFQPMHTKPIIPQRGYTPSGSSRSSRSRSESSVTYSKGDNHHSRQRHPVAL